MINHLEGQHTSFRNRFWYVTHRWRRFKQDNYSMLKRGGYKTTKLIWTAHKPFHPIWRPKFAKSFEILSIDLWSEDVDIDNRKNHKTKLRNTNLYLYLYKTHLCFIFKLCDQILPISRWYWNKCIGQSRSVSWCNRLLNIRQSISYKMARLEGGFFFNLNNNL